LIARRSPIARYDSTDAKHGVSRVRGGERVGLEVFFHHAPGGLVKAA
jgi:hypothetical protein